MARCHEFGASILTLDYMLSKYIIIIIYIIIILCIPYISYISHMENIKNVKTINIIVTKIKNVTITISRATHERIKSHGKMGQTFDTLINQILDHYENYKIKKVES